MCFADVQNGSYEAVKQSMDRRHGWRWIVGRVSLCYVFWIFIPLAIPVALRMAEIQVVTQDLHVLLLTVGLSTVLTTSATLALARWLDRRSWIELGVSRIHRLWTLLVFGLCLGALVPIIKLMILWGTGAYTVYGSKIPAAELWQYFVMVLMVIPSAWSQELVFRGYTLANLGDRLRPKFAIPVCGLAFVLQYLLGHSPTWPGVLNQSLMGMLLALAFLRQRNLWLPLWVHTGNSIANSLLFDKTFSLVTGTQNASMIIVDLASAVGALSATVLMMLVVARERLTQKVSQISHISETREQLKKSPSIEKSLELILKGAMKDLGMDIAAVFILNKEDRTAEIRALESNIKIDLGKAYSLDKAYVEFECTIGKQTTKIVGDGLTIFGAKSVHSTPVTFRGEAFGFLALGNMREQALDESDLSVLNLYSGLVTTAFETASLTVEPIKESLEEREGRYKIERGCSYMFADDTDMALEVFKDSVTSGMEGLCITRTFPDKVRERYDLRRTPIVWLTDEAVEGRPTVNSLQDLSIMISNYVEKAENPVLFIDGVEYLISRFGFNSVYQFLQSKRSQIEKTNSVLMITLFKDALDPKEVRLLEREFQLLTSTTMRRSRNPELA